MLDFRTQSQLLDSAATIMRSYFRAASNTFAASTSCGMSFWSEMVDAASSESTTASTVRPPWWLGPTVTFWAPLTNWTAWRQASFPDWSGWLTPTAPMQAGSSDATTGARQHSTNDRDFASYRSAGGHAAAQVIMGTAHNRSNGRFEPPKRT